MTQFIKNDFKSLTIIEGAKELLDKIPNEANIFKVHSLFEDYQPEKKFDTIIMEHILEHVESPDVLLKKVKTSCWDPIREPGKWSSQGYFRNVYELTDDDFK